MIPYHLPKLCQGSPTPANTSAPRDHNKADTTQRPTLKPKTRRLFEESRGAISPPREPLSGSQTRVEPPQGQDQDARAPRQDVGATAGCGHVVHPAHKGYSHPYCPYCRMILATERLNSYQEQIAGIPKVKAVTEDRTFLTDDYKRAMRGYANMEERKVSLKRQFDMDDVHTNHSWSRSKVQLANHVFKMAQMAEEEEKWDCAYSQNVTAQRAALWSSHSAKASLAAYKQMEPWILARDPGCPGTPTCGDSALSREEEDGPDERGERRKRRCLQFRFSEVLTLSGTHDIGAKASSTKPLIIARMIRDRPRGRALFNRKSPAYTPGIWASPAGYEMANTSWCGMSVERMERMLQQEDDDQEVEDEIRRLEKEIWKEYYEQQRKEEPRRQEQHRLEQLRKEQLRQELLRKEQLRLEQLQQEKLRQEKLRQEKLRPEQWIIDGAVAVVGGLRETVFGLKMFFGL